MSNKTPYEIRLEILQLAKDVIEKQQRAQLEFAEKAFSLAVAANLEAVKEWEKYVPSQFTIDEIMKQAAQLYSFVSKKD